MLEFITFHDFCKAVDERDDGDGNIIKQGGAFLHLNQQVKYQEERFFFLFFYFA